MISPEKTAIAEPINESPEYVTITALELAQLKDAAMQWQQARSGIERLLKLEREITYLVNHIDIINSKAIAQSNQGRNDSYAYSSTQAAGLPTKKYTNRLTTGYSIKNIPKSRRYANRYTKAPVNKTNIKARQGVAPSKPIKTRAAKVIANKKVFALQVASLDSQKSVAKAWQQLNEKAAPLFRDKISTNVEKAKVNNKTYYRLKLGEYNNFDSAEADCEVFKLYNIECIVSNFTDKPIRL